MPLSVPGRNFEYFVLSEMNRRYPKATGPFLCHRLEMSTSGIVVVAKARSSHQSVSKQFIDRTINERYECLLEGNSDRHPVEGKIDLPLMGDFINRRIQKVDFDQGKPTVTYYEILGTEEQISVSGKA